MLDTRLCAYKLDKQTFYFNVKKLFNIFITKRVTNNKLS